MVAQAQGSLGHKRSQKYTGLWLHWALKQLPGSIRVFLYSAWQSHSSWCPNENPGFEWVLNKALFETAPSTSSGYQGFPTDFNGSHFICAITFVSVIWLYWQECDWPLVDSDGPMIPASCPSDPRSARATLQQGSHGSFYVDKLVGSTSTDLMVIQCHPGNTAFRMNSVWIAFFSGSPCSAIRVMGMGLSTFSHVWISLPDKTVGTGWSYPGLCKEQPVIRYWVWEPMWCHG